MDYVLIKTGTYQKLQIADKVFPVIKGFKTGARGSYITVDGTTLGSDYARPVRIKCSKADIVDVEQQVASRPLRHLRQEFPFGHLVFGKGQIARRIFEQHRPPKRVLRAVDIGANRVQRLVRQRKEEELERAHPTGAHNLGCDSLREEADEAIRLAEFRDELEDRRAAVEERRLVDGWRDAAAAVACAPEGSVVVEMPAGSEKAMTSSWCSL